MQDFIDGLIEAINLARRAAELAVLAFVIYAVWYPFEAGQWVANLRTGYFIQMMVNLSGMK